VPPSGSSQGAPGPARIAQSLRIGSVVFLGIGERGEVTRERVLDIGECILHARRGGSLRHARLVSRQLEQLGEAAFVIA
jgi:hypothetical protein